MIRLSMREQEIIVKLAEAPESHAAVAKQMRIREHTLNVCLNRIYEKTETQSQTQLVLWALREARRMERLGLLDGDESDAAVREA